MPRFIDRELLRQTISKAFDDEELRTLCFALGVAYDDLPATGKSHKVRELVALCDRQDRLPALLAQCQKLRPNREWPVIGDQPVESPFKGLRYFDVADAPLFFGREALTEELLEHLRQHHFLAVIGASGSGKSSLVRAGVVAALQEGAIAGSHNWPTHIITPTERPLEQLALSLTREAESVTAATTLLDDMARDSRSLHLYVSRQRQQLGAEGKLLLSECVKRFDTANSTIN